MRYERLYIISYTTNGVEIKHAMIHIIYCIEGGRVIPQCRGPPRCPERQPHKHVSRRGKEDVHLISLHVY